MQLEAFENTRNILEKMNARVEDLQAQLEAKSQTERQVETVFSNWKHLNSLFAQH
jgi:hypothetical protein